MIITDSINDVSFMSDFKGAMFIELLRLFTIPFAVVKITQAVKAGLKCHVRHNTTSKN